LGRVSALAEIVLVTARPPRTARLMAQAIGAGDSVICCNGALVYDLVEEKILAHRPISPEDAQALIREIRAALPGSSFAFELGVAYGREPTYLTLAGHDSRPEDTEMLVGDALELCVVPVTKLIVRHSSYALPALLSAVQAVTRERMLVTHSGAPFVEISMAGVDKASALAAYARDRGVNSDDVLTFGDMPNDLPMLLWSGRRIAVANAHPDVLRAVSERTDSNENDGVARALERILLAGTAREGALAGRDRPDHDQRALSH
jgi:HAD superfamily hydrolase (TIGR01484 family)